MQYPSQALFAIVQVPCLEQSQTMPLEGLAKQSQAQLIWVNACASGSHLEHDRTTPLQIPLYSMPSKKKSSTYQFQEVNDLI